PPAISTLSLHDALPIYRGGVGAGMQAVCKPVVEDDKGQAERLADSNGNGAPSSGGSREEWKGFILSGSAIKPERVSPKNSAHNRSEEHTSELQSRGHLV